MTSLQEKKFLEQIRHIGTLPEMAAMVISHWILADVTREEVLYDVKGLTFI